MKCISFFTGAMGLDLGLEQAGIDITLAVESDPACLRTLRLNRQDLDVIGNFYNCDAGRLARQFGRPDLVVGGPPCQSFSTAGRRRGTGDTRGSLLAQYVDLALRLGPAYIVLENVRGLLSALDTEGTPALAGVLAALRGCGYSVSFNLYNAANFGVPQIRERLILIASRAGQGRVPHLQPTHSEDPAFGLPAWRTLRQALQDLPDVHNFLPFPKDKLPLYRLIGEGQHWRSLPEHLHARALGGALHSSGGRSSFLRRCAWDRPCHTLVTSPRMPSTALGHPCEDRPLSVQEYMRIQQFPDHFYLSGSTAQQYRQLGNAVPVGLGAAIGRAVLAHAAGRHREPPADFPFSRYKNTDEISWEKASGKRQETGL